MLQVDNIRKKLLTQRRDLFVRLLRLKRSCSGSKAISKAKWRSGGKRRAWFGCLIVWMGERRPRSRRSTGTFKLGTEQYGRCERCGKAIPQSRLEAVPAAAMCMPCEQAGEKQAALRK